jgi:hypothetical protein
MGITKGAALKKLFAPILGACLIASSPAGASVPTPEQQAELAEAQAIIDVMLPPAQRQKMFDDMLTTITNQMRQGMQTEALADPGVNAIVSKYLDRMVEAQKPLLQKHVPAMTEAIATAYSNEFSLAELKDIHAFANTPSGRHYLSRSLALVSDPAVAKVNMAMIKETQQLILGMRDDLKAELLAYYEAHPEAITKGKADAK